jgi:site-specific recombinase XerD
MPIKSALLDIKLREVIQRKHYSRNTYKTYRVHCESFVVWLRDTHGGKWIDPKDVGEPEVTGWLTWLATHRKVSAKSQNTALQAVCFLYRHCIGRQLKDVQAVRAKVPQRLPCVLSVPEVSALLQNLHGQNLLIAQLLYGSGLRIGEALALRVKDLMFESNQICVRSGKGDKDRLVQMPRLAIERIKLQLETARKWHTQDTADGCCRV